MIDIEKILKLEAKATPGPWIDTPGMGEIFPSRFGSIKTNHWFGNCEKTPYSTYSDGFCDTYVQDENSQFIVEMRNNIKSICLELIAAREVINSARFVLARHDSDSFGGHRDIACSACVLDANIREYDEVVNEKC